VQEEIREANGGQCGAVMTGATQSPALRQYVRQIAGITVHTRIEGIGTRTRHVFERGEIAFYPVGGVKGKENLHLRFQRPAADR